MTKTKRLLDLIIWWITTRDYNVPVIDRIDRSV